jgi:hypothetical protein
MPLPAGRESEYIEDRDREMNERHMKTCTYVGCSVCRLIRGECDYFDPHFEKRENGGFL